MYHAPLKAVYTVSKRHIPLLAVVTDLGSVLRIWYHDVADLYLVATEAVRAQALSYGLPPQRVRITGIPVHPDMICEDRSPAAVRAELGWDPDRTTLLAVGSKRVTNLYDALRALNHAGMPLQLALVAGGDDELYQRLLETTWHVPATVQNFVDNMPTLMRAADCILCKAGGMIVSEALACGLPLLLVDALPGQEAGNAEHVVKGGAGELVRDPLALLETLHHWLANGGALLAQRAENARRLGQPRAAYVIADLVWEAARRGPRREGPLVRLRRSKVREQLKRNGIL
jgi:1,2-diacylglycerol 3-beta-galactosyltransferase